MMASGQMEYAAAKGFCMSTGICRLLAARSLLLMEDRPVVVVLVERSLIHSTAVLRSRTPRSFRCVCNMHSVERKLIDSCGI
jgi:hypothetical protein